MRLGGP